MPRDPSFQNDSAYGSRHPPKGKASKSIPDGQPTPSDEAETDQEKQAREAERDADRGAPATADK